MGKKINLMVAISYSIIIVVIETSMNVYWDDWSFYPLWIIDYLIAIILLSAVFIFKNNIQNSMLLMGWSISVGVTYMALFISLDPNGLKSEDIETKLPLFILALIVSIFGLILTIIDLQKINHLDNK
ncbi:MAG: hypothetical protein CMD13_02970 [Flavobacteriales bacterium]|nr:hypothetical protein [Flavobacteriales bacterium]